MTPHLVAAVVVAAIIAFGQVLPGTAAPIEVFWTCLGGGGGVFALHVTLRRARASHIAARYGADSLNLLTTRSHVVLRGCGFIMQILVFASGISSMLTPPSVRPELVLNDYISGGSIVGLGIILCFANWYAERTANQQLNYILPPKDG